MSSPSTGVPEPPAPHGGLNVVDFPQQSVVSSVRKAIRLLPPSKRRIFVLAGLAQISMGILDLIGIVLIGLVAAVAVSGIGASQIPPIAQQLLDRLGIGNLTVSQLSVLLALLAVTILVGKTFASALLLRLITVFLARQQADLATRLSRAFLRLPLTDVQRWTSSEAIYALGTGTSAATVSLLSSAIIIAAEIFLFVIVGVSLFVFDPLLTISAVLLFSLIVVVMHRVLGRWTARNATILKNASIDSLTAVSEALSTYREATVLNRRDLYAQRYQNLAERSAVAYASNSFIAEIPKYALEVALYVGILVLGVVQFLTKDWAAAASTVALFLAAGSRIMPALLRLQGAGITIRNSSIMAQPTFYMAEFVAREKPTGSEGGMTADVLCSHIEAGYQDFTASVKVHEATLTYDGAREPALVDASLDVPAGNSVALVGPTGAGKSTLADIILGVISPDVGEARLGGLDPRLAIDRWPGAIAYVPQQVALIEGSVRENVALGLPRHLVSDELVWESLERAHISDFLRDQREGLDTPIGERGFRLSGGQRQRLGIARALYTRPKLLVLDEATSALDAETEIAIIATLQELEGTVTTITIAHRLATVRNADEVLYLDHGRIVARGSFPEVRAAVKDFDAQARLLGL